MVMSAIHIARRIAIITIFARLSWCAILIGLRRHVARLALYWQVSWRLLPILRLRWRFRCVIVDNVIPHIRGRISNLVVDIATGGYTHPRRYQGSGDNIYRTGRDTDRRFSDARVFGAVSAGVRFIGRIISDVGVKSRARRAFVVARRLFPRRDMGLRMMEEGTSPVSAKKFSRRAF